MRSLDFPTFRSRFNRIAADLGIGWYAVGFLAPDDSVLVFGTDTKVISTVFECYTGPVIHTIANELGYSVEGAPQTVYPDFTLTRPDHPGRRIAIDVKTTYRKFNRKGDIRKFRYTLGSYTSFLRSPGAKKSILYPYAEYSEHWVIGFLYTRVPGVPAKLYPRREPKTLPCPYEDVEYFIQEKYKIAGESPGSGNTKNIGSFPTANIDDLRGGRGPFAAHGKELCDEYWRYYGLTTAQREYSTVEAFLRWREGKQ